MPNIRPISDLRNNSNAISEFCRGTQTYGKRKADLMREYDLIPTALINWKNRINATGSAKASDNRSSEEIKLIALEKENKQLRMENDILKQAALILRSHSEP